MRLNDAELDGYLAKRPAAPIPEWMPPGFRPRWADGTELSPAAARWLLGRVLSQVESAWDVEVERIRVRIDPSSAAAWLDQVAFADESYDRERFPAIAWALASFGADTHLHAMGKRLSTLWVSHRTLPLGVLRRNGSDAAIRWLAFCHAAEWHRKLGQAAFAELEALAAQRNIDPWTLIDGATRGVAQSPAALQRWFALHLEEAMWTEHRFSAESVVRAAAQDALAAQWLRALAWRGPDGVIPRSDVRPHLAWVRIALPTEVQVTASPEAPFDQHTPALIPFSVDSERPFVAHLRVASTLSPSVLAERLEARGYRRDAPEDAGNVYGATRRVRSFFVQLSHSGRPVKLRDAKEPVKVVDVAVREGSTHRVWTDVPSGLRIMVMTDLAELLWR